MGIKVQFLKALNGDSILITMEDADIKTRILIDGGPPQSFKSMQPGNSRNGFLKKTLKRLIQEDEKIDLVILTHVDDDHIGGLLKGFEDPNFLPKIVKSVIFNSGRLIFEHFNLQSCTVNDLAGNFDGRALTSISQGISFEQLILNLNIWDRRLFWQSSNYQGENFSLQFLSPGEAELKNLAIKWANESVSSLTASHKTDYEKSYEELLLNDSFSEDTSVHNGSSLSFILTYQEKNYLFLGDAFPSTVIDGLKKLGFSERNKLNVDLVKLSHHGSKSNTSIELLKMIATQQYVISTDGSKHGLPNKMTLARIHHVNPDATILFNYEELISQIYSPFERSILQLKLKPYVDA
jgi:beta-lactamase superfamily II metal-dependent hydrolase